MWLAHPSLSSSALALRTRANGAIIGTLNVDTAQEVQVVTANYNAEYGRTSGGQLRYDTHQHWDRSLFSDAPWRFQRTLEPD